MTCTFRPIGRLGNNMFQTAACIDYAKKHGMKWAIPDRRAHNDTFEDKPTPWLLPKYWPNLPMIQYGPGNRYEQHDASMFNYKPIPYFQGGVTLVGFFQSEKWFENAKDEVKEAFPLKYYPEYEGYVSIHVRRGDYVTNSNSFPPLTSQYLDLSIKQFPLGQNFLVFSDDIDYCKGIIKGFQISYNEDQDEYTALSKMASCSHHIIANSTFSWWGAWLGHNPDRIVVSPHYEQWFGPGFSGSAPKDLIPDNWIQIKI